ncbi:MAG TPA: type IV pilus secretin PilQ [Myxococcaceae bacterium]|nr:type IV pilus secretin PilQ [Myxococcaceae bacterium]
MRTQSAVTLIGWLAVIAAGPSLAAEPNVLSDVRLESTPSGARVVVTGSRPPIFTVFRLAGPDRLVIDVTSADAAAIRGAREGQGPVAGINVSQFTDSTSSVGRVLVTLREAKSYDVKADGNLLLISVVGPGATSAPAASAPPAIRALAPSALVAAPAAPAPAAAPSSVATPSPAAASSGDVVSVARESRPVKTPARRLTAVRARGDTLQLSFDGEVRGYELLRLTGPNRLALDVTGVKLATSVRKASGGPFSTLRAGAHPDKVRLVVDVDEARDGRVEFARNGLRWTVSAPATPAAAIASTPPAPPARGKGDLQDGEVEIDGRRVVTAAAAAPAQGSPAEMLDLGFVESSRGGRIQIKLSRAAQFEVERPDDRGAVLTLTGVRLPRKLERSLDTSALETPIRMISTFAVPGDGQRVRVVVAADGALTEHAERVADGLLWHLEAKGTKTEEVAVSNRTAGFTTEPAVVAAQTASGRTRYVGKKVSFEFKDIDIHNLLRVIAEVSKKNIVVADDVTGKITIRLRNVPWDQALDIILASKGLGKEEIGDIIRVAPLKTLEEEARSREERKKAMRRQEDLVVQLIPVNYAAATDMAARVKDVLSERGTVAVDARTNTLVVRDIGSNIGKARGLVEKLDSITPQVLIESRIVEANTTFSRSIGVQWGGFGQAAPSSGNATGLSFPNTVRVTGGSDLGTASATGISSAPNFAVNLPAAVGAGAGGALGFTFGSANGALNLNLRLSAAESNGTVKTISAPKVTTLQNQKATISQGVSIPFSQVSAQGVNTTFVEARLQLDVTPHITSDGSVLMAIRATNNQPDPANTGANGQPAIQKKEAETQVLVKDGDTTVIGGIYVRRGSTTEAGVPWLMKIPILGFFFKTNTVSENRQELLIFITPRIVTQTVARPVASASAPAGGNP